MTLESESLLDPVGWEILRALQENARISYSELGRQIGLSSPAIADRVRRLEEAGIITGYRAELNLEKLGLPIMAFMRVVSPPGQFTNIGSSFTQVPEVLECHRVTGSDDYILKVAVSSVTHLESLIDQFPHSQVITLIVLSSPVKRRTVDSRIKN
ncbi:Lrp/AsnC family transcriptional regulator [Oscillatoria sp. FACHB-1407]|uniref:Lrp/AsnC family transcriptional regulator n=1 Tax=Oscillatoria sp. FACHB-1407 TaxID=2692847 RepID=UPI001682CA54|nr:Lrp/AsnC family transcriptional regulator [Oscillatoria sp. FACHB-1407]MBD2459575.1 Lrp/AsnC family transcriptional regulator [Oscillatoria sp. FACHB-1407]